MLHRVTCYANLSIDLIAPSDALNIQKPESILVVLGNVSHPWRLVPATLLLLDLRPYPLVSPLAVVFENFLLLEGRAEASYYVYAA